MPSYGFTERQVRDFLVREIGKSESSSSFYWESEEVEEAVEVLVGAIALLIEANNKKLTADLEKEARRRRL